jgi:hypothetical protein
VAKSALPPELIKLREVYSSGVAAKAMLDDFASRTNNQRITKVDQILNRLRADNVQRWESIALFRKLEELGHGKFIEGRKGHPSRFVWSSSPIDVGKAAQGNEAPITPVSSDAANDDNSGEMRDYVFPLRSDTDATFELPIDLTQKEAERLSAFLRTLAVPE